MLDPLARTEDTITSWVPLGVLGPVDSLIGATIHTGAGKPYLLLFVRVVEGAGVSLTMRPFDLEAGRWLQPRSLLVPESAHSGFDAAILRKYESPGDLFESDLSDIPTLIAIQPKNDGIFLRKLKDDLSGWDIADWAPVQGPTANTELLDLVQVRSDEAALVLGESGIDKIYCRTISLDLPFLNDDFVSLSLGAFDEAYGGSIGWPSRSELVAFTNSSLFSRTRYRTAEFETTQVGIPDNNPAFSEETIAPIEERLRDEIGVSLNDPALYQFENFKPFLWVPANTNQTHAHFNTNIGMSDYSPLNVEGLEEQGEIDRPRPTLEPFNGTLYDVLTLSINAFNQMVGGFDNESAYINGDDERQFYLIQYKKLALDKFFADLDTFGETDPFGDQTYWWGFLDQQIVRLTQGSYNLRGMVKQLFYNTIEEFMELFNWDINFSEKVAPIVFVQRLSEVDISNDRPAGNRVVRIAGTAGYEHLPGGSDAKNQKPVAYVVDHNRSKWAVLNYESHVSAFGDYPVAPGLCAGFGIVPPRERVELIARQEFSRAVYTNNPDALPSMISLFHELFFLVPVMLGEALCVSGYHDEGLDWLRTVYDYGGEPGERKIDYGLVLEENRPLSYVNIDEWLKDTDDVHAVALTRRETDTRRVLLSIIACMVDKADGLFARDLPESISEARDLYNRALDLLAHLESRTGAQACKDIIGSLRFELEAPDRFPIDEFTIQLAQIGRPDALRDVISNLVSISQNTALPPGEAVVQMRTLIASSVPRQPESKPLARIMTRQDQLLRRVETRALSVDSSRTLLNTVRARSAEQRFETIRRIASAQDIDPREAMWLTSRRDPERPNNNGRIPAEAPSRFSLVKQRFRTQPLRSLGMDGFGFRAPTSNAVLSFCIPQNPEISALKLRAETALHRIRTCRDIAGYERLTDPYGGPIGLGTLGTDPTVPEVVTIPPVPLRYSTLINRARQLAETASQIEARYLQALEGEDRERLTRLQVSQNLEVAEARVARQSLAVSGAMADVELARRQRQRAIISVDHYDGLILAGTNEHEQQVIEHYLSAGQVSALKKVFKAISSIGKLAAGAYGIGNPLDAAVQFIDVADGITKKKECKLPQRF